MGGVWPMTHLFEHYRFTGNETFLREQALPILNGIVEFYNDFLIERDGYLVTAPSVSTENAYITSSGVEEAIAIGPTADSYVCFPCRHILPPVIPFPYSLLMGKQFLREILTNFLNASTVVGSKNLVSEAEAMLSKIRTPFIPNYYGGIRQWWDDWTEVSNSNPTIDPILGLYPFGSINFWEHPTNVSNLTAMAEATLVHFLAETKPGSSWADTW